MSLNAPKNSSMRLKAVYQHIVDNILAVVATSCLVALVRLGLVELISWLRELQLQPAHLFLAGFVPAAAATSGWMVRRENLRFNTLVSHKFGIFFQWEATFPSTVKIKTHRLTLSEVLIGVGGACVRS